MAMIKKTTPAVHGLNEFNAVLTMEENYRQDVDRIRSHCNWFLFGFRLSYLVFITCTALPWAGKKNNTLLVYVTFVNKGDVFVLTWNCFVT